jgi:hypothetical protein
MLTAIDISEEDASAVRRDDGDAGLYFQEMKKTKRCWRFCLGASCWPRLGAARRSCWPVNRIPPFTTGPLVAKLSGARRA